MTMEFQHYDINELDELARSKSPKRVGVILDEATVEFLLAMQDRDREVDEETVEELARSLEENVLQTAGTIEVANLRLVDGRNRLLAIRNLGCPDDFCVTVVFG